MVIPAKITRPDKNDRKRIKEAIAREAELKKRALGIGEFKFGGKPSGIIFAVAILAFAGILLLSRARPPEQPGLRTREMIAEQDLGVLTIALQRFRNDCGRYPTTEEGLHALIRNPGIENWPKPYVTHIRPDPWKKHYFYSNTNDSFTLISAGPDKIKDTQDDIFPPVISDPAQPDSTTLPVTTPASPEEDQSDTPQQ